MQLRQLTLMCIVIGCLTSSFAAPRVDISECYDEGQVAAEEATTEACTTVLAACKGGAKAPKSSGSKTFDPECTQKFYSGCAESPASAAALRNSACKGTYAGDATCATADFQALFKESVKNLCGARATKYVVKAYDDSTGELLSSVTGKEVPAGAAAGGRRMK